ncbi:MAG TPA: hypothetical protein VGB52_02665, partial [Actinomycetota bacterium]
RGGTVSLPVDDAVAFRRAIEAGETSGQRARSLANLDALLEQNQRIYAAIEDVTTKPGQGLGLGGQFEGAATRAVLGNIAGGPVGAVAAAVAPKVIDRIKSAVIERLGRASGEAADRVTTALDGVLAKGGTIASKARPTTTGILTRISYAAEAPAKAAKPTSTLEAFRAREQELRSITVGTPDGRLRMTRSARAQIAAGLREVAEVSPRMADQMETVAARKVEFLASKLPKRPDLMGLQTNWRPSDMDIAAFARSAQAAEDPASVFERVNDGSVTPEDAEALKAVYPEMFAEARAELLGSLSEIGGELSYERKLALSILYDVPVDPSMDPRVLRVLQGHFAEDVVGGGSPPMPQPQSGSVSKSVDGATKAQQLSQPRGAGEGAGAS